VTESLRQEVTIAASPDRVFAALVDGDQFSAMTGAPAEIDSAPGGAFSCFGGAITGRNIEVVPGRRLVQGWRAGPWPEGVYSIVRFEFSGDGENTRLTLDHAGFPPGSGDHLGAGWEANYWSALRRHFS